MVNVGIPAEEAKQAEPMSEHRIKAEAERPDAAGDAILAEIHEEATSGLEDVKRARDLLDELFHCLSESCPGVGLEPEYAEAVQALYRAREAFEAVASSSSVEGAAIRKMAWTHAREMFAGKGAA